MLEKDVLASFHLLSAPVKVPSRPVHSQALEASKSFRGQFWIDFGQNGMTISELDSLICNYFRQISFYFWFLFVYGRRAEAVNDLLISVAMIRHKYENGLLDKLNDSDLISHLSQSASLHPLTRGILKGGDNQELPIEWLESLLEPIRQVSRREKTKRTKHRMAILKLRFEVAYIWPSKVDWSLRVSTRFGFYDGLVSRAPADLAVAMTLSDISAFKNIDVAEFWSDSPSASDERWTSLCRETAECAIACPCLVPVSSVLATVCANFHVDLRES